MINVSEQSIDRAACTFRDFVKVQQQNDHETRLEAISNFARASGVEDAEFEYVCETLSKLIESPDGSLGWAIIGWLLGMLTAQYEAERG